MINNHLIYRSVSLAKVLWFGVYWLRATFITLVCVWCVIAFIGYANISMSKMVTALLVPGLLQLALVMFLGFRGGQLLMNSQLHLVGIRKELFLNSFCMCLLFALCFFDPKNEDNLINAKFIVFAFYSVGFFWMFWFYCLQLLSMLVVAFVSIVSMCLIFVIGVKLALLFFSISLWGYFAFWLSRNSLQRQFKFESFSGLVDYCVERLKLVGLKKALTKVNHKEHVVLMREGDGYLNRIILAPIFILVFTSFYVLVLRSIPKLSLWMILLLLGGTQARIKIMQSQARLWLLNDQDRLSQFKITENIMLRLTLYPFITASLLLAIWCQINPALARDGVAAFILSLLFIIMLDYCFGFIHPGAKTFLITSVFTKMIILFALVHIHIDITWYVLIAITLIGILVVARNRARKNFLVGNLSMRVQ